MKSCLSRLERSKVFRDAVKKWGEPDGSRKRIIVAPPMAGMVAKDVAVDLGVSEIYNERKANLDPDPEISQLIKKLTLGGNHYDVDSEKQYLELLEKFNSYTEWLRKQKIVRNELNNLDLSAEWLLRKKDRTELEDRVLARMLPPPKEKESKFDSRDGTPQLTESQLLLLPLLQQPVPIALSIITEYCVTKRLRLLDLFVQADKDKDWHISKEEFTEMIISRQIPLAKCQIDGLISALDKDNNNQLNYKELARGMEAYKINDRWHKIKELMELQNKLAKDGHVLFQLLSPKSKTPKDTLSSDSLLDLEESDSSFLELPFINSNGKIALDDKQLRENRAKKHRQKKDKLERNRRAKGTHVPATTLRGDVRQVKDRYAHLMLRHTNDIIDRIHLNGIPIKTETVQRVMLFPYDKSVEECKSNLRQPGLVHSMLHHPGLDRMSQFLKNEESLIFNETQERRSRRKRRKKDRLRDGCSSVRRIVETDPFWPQNDNHVLHLDDLKKGRSRDSIFQTVKPHYCL